MHADESYYCKHLHIGFDAGLRGARTCTAANGVLEVRAWRDPVEDLLLAGEHHPGRLRRCNLGSGNLNRWTLLVGVYDRTAGVLRLYVNGVLAATTARTVAPWQATSSFVVGRGTAGTATPGLWFNGDISDARVWDRVAYQSDVDALSPVILAGQWNLADATGYDSITAIRGADDVLL